MPSSKVIFTVLASLVAVSLGQSCYGLDGSVLDSTYAPCNTTTKFSGCCATKRTSGNDICLDSGLCLSTRPDYMGMIWQAGCTDPTGRDASCPRACPDANTNFGGQLPVPGWNIQTCDYGKYCCRALNDQRSCCNNGTSPKLTTSSIGALFASTSPTPLASSAATPTPTLTFTTSISIPTPTSPSTNTCAKERRQTAIAAGTTASLLGAVILALSIVTLMLHKREKHQRKLKEHYEEQFSQTRAYRKTIASSAASLLVVEGGEDAKSRRGET